MLRTALLSLCLVVATQLQSSLAQPQVGQPAIELQAGHTTPLWALAASPDGRLVASGGLDRTIKIWSLPDARLLRTLDGTLGIEALAFSPDGRLLASSARSAIALFDVTTGSQIRRIAACDDVYKVRMLLSDFGSGEPSAVAALAFSPTGKFLASACDGDEHPKVWGLATGAEVKHFAAPPRPKEPADDFGIPIAEESAGFSSIAFDFNERWLAAGAADHTVRVWEFSTGKRTQVLRGHSRDVRALAFTADGRFITGSDGQRSILWNVGSGATVHNRDGVWSAFDSQGRWMVAGSGGNVTTSALEGLGGDQSAGRLPPNPPAVLSTNGQWLIGTDGKTLVARNLTAGTVIRLLDVVVANRRMVASHDGSLLALQPYYSNDPTLSLKLWNLGTNDIRTLSGPGAAHAVFSRDDRVLAAAADDKMIRLWDAATARELRTFAFAESVASLSLNSTGTLLTASGHIGKARLWDVNGDRALPDYGEDDHTGGARFSPDNRWLAYTVGPAIKIVDAETGQAVRTINGRRPMTFSADSRMLAAVAADMTVKIWDLSNGRTVRTLKGDFYAASITFSPDRRWLALRDMAERVFLWDLKRGGDARMFSGHTIGFTAGGTLLWTSREDGITRFWNAESGALVASLAMIEGSNDWAVATPDGRFDGTTVGIQTLIAWRSGDRVLPPDQFMERRAQGLLARLMTQ